MFGGSGVSHFFWESVYSLFAHCLNVGRSEREGGNKMGNAYKYKTKLATIVISENGTGLTHLDMVAYGDIPKGYEEKETPLLAEAAKQLDEYFMGKRKQFDLPLDPSGTSFQKKVWEQLCLIPYGETRTYKQIAEAAGCPKGARAVGMVNNRNPIMIVIPCHRVIGANGSLVGFGGGIDVKEALLNLEKQTDTIKMMRD